MNFGYSAGHSDGPGWIAVVLIVALGLVAFFALVAPAIQ